MNPSAINPSANTQSTVQPIPSDLIVEALKVNRIADVGRASIREIRSLIDWLEARHPLRFIRMEMGIPGLPVDQLATEAEIAALRDGVAASYPPVGGLPQLKQEISAFVKNFLDIEIAAENCIPTVGSVMGSYAAFMVAGRAHTQADTVLLLDPGFPLHAAQARMIGLRTKSIDVYNHRGAAALRAALEAAATETQAAGSKIGVMLYSNPNNPSWICFTDAELQEIARFADAHGIVVVEDLAYFAMDFRKQLGKPGRPPFQVTVARYTENYILMISSSKAFSYAGQRVGMLCIGNRLANRTFPDLSRFYPYTRFADALILGTVYATTAGTAHSAQFGLAALLAAANSGQLDFVDNVKLYGRKAAAMKALFLRHGFHIVYDTDIDQPIADGFYFTVGYGNLTGDQLLAELLPFGISAISLATTGSTRAGIRACVSLVPEERIPELDPRLAAFVAAHPAG